RSDDAGNLQQASNPAATYTYAYDALGRLNSDQQNITGLMSDTPGSTDVEYINQYNNVDALTETQAKINGVNDFKNTYSYADPSGLANPYGRLRSITQQGVTGGNTLAAKRADFTYND